MKRTKGWYFEAMWLVATFFIAVSVIFWWLAPVLGMFCNMYEDRQKKKEKQL